MSKPKNRKQSPHVIVLGNEKGGSGKSTTTMHLAIALLRDGWKVGTIDLDGQQATLTKYLENRTRFSARHGLDLCLPEHFSIARAHSDSVTDNRDAEFEAFKTALERLANLCQVILIDTPGSDSYLMRLGHMLADTLITPMNDSFMDLEVVGKIDGDNHSFLRKGSYAEMVCSCRDRQIIQHTKHFDWIVMRNRLSPLQAQNKRHVFNAIEQMAKELEFTPFEGLHERVIYRELFPLGLTILEATDQFIDAKLSISHILARQELRSLVNMLKLPKPKAPANWRRARQKNKNIGELA